MNKLSKEKQNALECHLNRSVLVEAPPGFEPGNRAFAELCLTTWLWRHIKF